MKKIPFIFYLLCVQVCFSQELKATLLSVNEVELEIMNPDELWFFIPTYAEELPFFLHPDKQYQTDYGIAYFLFKEDKDSECDFTFNDFRRPYRPKNYYFGFSGKFSKEKIIKYRFNFRYGTFLGKDCDNQKELYIQFALVQSNIEKFESIRTRAKSFLKDYKPEDFFNGELYSNKILLKTKK